MDLKLFPKKNFFFLLFRGMRIIFFVVFVRGSRKTKYLSKCFLICFLYPALHLLFSAQQRNFSCLIFHHAEHNKHEFNLSITEVFFCWVLFVCASHHDDHRYWMNIKMLFLCISEEEPSEIQVHVSIDSIWAFDILIF